MVCLGVLHHTDNCLLAIKSLLTNTVAKGGMLYVGLYHTHGRTPFLRYFEDLKKQGASEEALFTKYRELQSYLKDETHLRSWFRDQVLHPHETQHTLVEVMEYLKDQNVTLLSTSLNRFQPIKDVAEVYAMEKGYEDLGLKALAEKRYFPGFFTFLLKA